MSAATTDKLDRVTDSTTGRPVLAQLVTPGKAIGASSITCNNLTNWTTTTKIHFSIYNLTSAGVKDPTTQTDWTGIVSGNTITNLTLTGGTDQTYNPGAIVDPGPTAAWAKDLYDCLSGFANQNGTLQTAAVQAALNLGNTPSAGWTPIGATPSYSANNGAHEFVITFPIDLTSTLNKGMKIQFTRSTTPNTQCGAFQASSSQYATKASPAGITFTGNWAAEALVYLNSYPGGSTPSGAVIGRYNNETTSGFGFQIHADGSIQAFYYNASGSTSLGSTRALALKRWYHIATSVNVSAKTAVMAINGESVPTQSYASSATSVVQNSDNLSVGADHTGLASTFLDGYLAEVRLWGTNIPLSQIQSNQGINLTGSETNLIGLWPMNGNFNDKTTNANNMTATNGAVATQTFSTINGGTTNEPTPGPMNSVEYGFVTDVSIFTGGITTVKVFTGTDYVIPNAGLSASQYSISRSPFGFPAGRDKWKVDCIMRSDGVQASVVNATWYNIGSMQLAVPTGEWKLGYQFPVRGSNSTGQSDVVSALSTSNNASTIPAFQARSYISASNINLMTLQNRSNDINLGALTTYYAVQQNCGGGGSETMGIYGGSDGDAYITAESAYI